LDSGLAQGERGAVARIGAGSARTILVADDDPAVRELLRTTLERHGHKVLEARSATEIFKTLETEQLDVLLLDVHLGPEDGLAIGAGLRRERENNSIKILFMSETPDEAAVIRLSRLWKVPILVKPVDFDALFDAIDR
jgi:DNA-binding response OmpR family regulator